MLIHRDADNDIITLMLSGLAERIVEALHLDDDTSPVENLADSYLPLDGDSEPPHELYIYASIVGKLDYLQGHSYADIKFIVSQVSCYIFCPKRCYKRAPENICRYLKITITEGRILEPKRVTNKFKFNIHVDVAFASGWGTQQRKKPDSVISHIGLFVEVMCCPVIWYSNLQPCITISKMESEYTALFMSLQVANLLMTVTEAINDSLQFIHHQLLTFKTMVHKDNIALRFR